MKTIDPNSLNDLQLAALSQAHAITTVELLADGDGGWMVRVNRGPYLRSQRELRRRFASLDTAARYLKARGVSRVIVELGLLGHG